MILEFILDEIRVSLKKLFTEAKIFVIRHEYNILHLNFFSSELRCSSGFDIGARGKPHAPVCVHVVCPAASRVLH
jgi:hypothetical protein